MKPLKVFSLVLLALLLLVPAVSAETYTLIDEDLVFGDSGTSSGLTLQFSLLSETVDVTLNSDRTLLDGSILPSGTRVSTYYYAAFDNYVVVGSNSYPISSFLGNNRDLLIDVSSTIFPGGYVSFGKGDNRYFNAWVYYPYDSSGNPPSPSVPSSFVVENYWVPSSGSSSGVTQHVTVTYDDQSENYQVYVDTSDESVDVWVRGYVFGWLPVWTFGSNAFPPSTHFEWLTCPVRFLFWDVDWEVEVECNGESKFVYWNLDTPPIDGGTIPEPDPPFPDPDPGLPDDPDPFNPTTPFPTPSYNPSGLPNKIPTSLKEIIGFNLTEIKDRFKESTPFYSNAFDFVASAIEALFDFLFGLIAGTLGILIGFLSEPLTDIYNFIVWTSSVVFSFMDFLIIPNHIMSFLADFVPVEIVNLALAALGLDILLNVLSIAIPDLITAYKSTVRTYYHKVDHGIQKGGKK